VHPAYMGYAKLTATVSRLTRVHSDTLYPQVHLAGCIVCACVVHERPGVQLAWCVRAGCEARGVGEGPDCNVTMNK